MWRDRTAKDCGRLAGSGGPGLGSGPPLTLVLNLQTDSRSRLPAATVAVRFRGEGAWRSDQRSASHRSPQAKGRTGSPTRAEHARLISTACRPGPGQRSHGRRPGIHGPRCQRRPLRLPAQDPSRVGGVRASGRPVVMLAAGDSAERPPVGQMWSHAASTYVPRRRSGAGSIPDAAIAAVPFGEIYAAGCFRRPEYRLNRRRRPPLLYDVLHRWRCARPAIDHCGHAAGPARVKGCPRCAADYPLPEAADPLTRSAAHLEQRRWIEQEKWAGGGSGSPRVRSLPR
jgi:hypothetical protein